MKSAPARYITEYLLSDILKRRASFLNGSRRVCSGGPRPWRCFKEANPWDPPCCDSVNRLGRRPRSDGPTRVHTEASLGL